MTNLHVDQGSDGQLLLLALEGELDYASVGAFEAAYATRVDGQRATVVDLRRVRFMDSSGIAALMKVRRSELEHGRRLALIRGPSNLQRVFALTGINAVFDFVEEPGEALLLDGN